MPPPSHSDNRSGKSKHLLANFDLALAEVFSILDHYRVQKPMAPQHDSLTVSPKTFPQNHLAQRRLWICQNFPAPGIGEWSSECGGLLRVGVAAFYAGKTHSSC